MVSLFLPEYGFSEEITAVFLLLIKRNPKSEQNELVLQLLCLMNI